MAPFAKRPLTPTLSPVYRGEGERRDHLPPWRRGGEEDVAHERQRGCSHERRPDDREAVRVASVDPHEGDRRAGEVEQHVEQPEEGGRVGYGLERVLDPALAVDAERALNRNDVVGVAHGGLDVRVAGAADQLVDAVERHEPCDLADT